MNILYQPQLSMRSYRDNRFLVTSDAQFTKFLAYVGDLPSDWEYTIILPAPEQFDNEALLMLPENVHYVPCPCGDNVLENRYHFDMRFAKMLLGMNYYDVMLNEIPEHTRAWRTAQRYVEHEFPIIAMVEHVDIYEETRVPEQVAFHLRQVDGALCADRVAFPLHGMKMEWLKSAADLGLRQDITNEVLRRSVVWNAIFSPYEVLEKRTSAWPVDPGKPVINFISRLSDNQRTRYKEFFHAVQILDDQGEEFEVWVQNPNEAQDENAIGAYSRKITRIGNSGRDDYIASLWGSDIVPILYPTEFIYSLGHCEAVTAKNMILGVSQDLNHYACDPSRPESIARMLGRMFKEFRERKSNWGVLLDQQMEYLMRDRSTEENIDNVRSTIENVVNRAKART